MNRKAQAGMGIWVIFGMMIGAMIWLAFTQIISPLTDETQNARSVTGLDCDNTSISTGTKGTCVIVDAMGFGFSGTIIMMIIGAITGAIIKKKVDGN